MGQRCDCGVATQSLTCCPAFLLGWALYSLSLLSGISSEVPPCEFWESLTSQVSGAFWRVPPTSYFLRLPVSILSAGPQDFSPLPSPKTRSGSLLPTSTLSTLHLLSFPSPSLPTYDGFLFSPKWDCCILTWVLQLVNPFEFCGLYHLVYSFFF